MPPPPAPKANGTVSTWQTVAPMLTPRANHCAASTQGYLFVLGGNHEDASGNFSNIGTVDAAQLMPDGTLGTWKQAGMLPNPMSQCTATADATHLYIVDAVYDDDSTYGRQLWVADVATDGAIGAWTALATLPGTLRVLLQQAWVSGTQLIAMTSLSPPDGNGTEALEISVSGMGNAWSMYDWTSDFRGWPQYAFNGSYAWIFGGYTSGTTTVDSDGYGVPLSSSGFPGEAFLITALPQPTTAGDAAAVDGFVFLFGGKSDTFAGEGSAMVYSASIGQGGSLGNWNTQTSLPGGRAHLRATVAGDFVYVTGGALSGGGLDTVFAARIRF
jgi:hypothetical protein